MVIFLPIYGNIVEVEGNSLLLRLKYLSPQRAGLQWEKGFLGRGYEQRRTWTLEIYFPKICSDLALDFETVSIYLLLQGFPLFRVNYWVKALIHFFRCMERNVILTIRNWWWTCYKMLYWLEYHNVLYWYQESILILSMSVPQKTCYRYVVFDSVD